MNRECRSLHNEEEFDSLYRSPKIFREIKYRRLRWAGNVARMEEDRSILTTLADTHTGKRPLGKPMVEWRTILQWISKKWVTLRGIALIWLMIVVIGEPL